MTNIYYVLVKSSYFSSELLDEPYKQCENLIFIQDSEVLQLSII